MHRIAVPSMFCPQPRPHYKQVLVELCDAAAESTSASVVDESTSAGGAGGVAAEEVPENESMEISPPGPACLAGPAGPNEAPPEALANAAAAAGLSTPSSNSLEGEVNLPSPLRLDGSGSPDEPQGGAMNGPLPETEAKQRGLKRVGGAGASEPWSAIAAWAEDSRLHDDDDDQAASVGTAGSKLRCGASRSTRPARPPSARSKRARTHFRPIRNEDGSGSSSSS